MVWDPDADASASGLGHTAEAAIGLIGEGRRGLCDFQGTSPEEVSPVHLAMLLRAASNSECLSLGWARGLDLCRRACVLRGVDPDDALFGLEGAGRQRALEILSVEGGAEGPEAYEALCSWLSVFCDMGATRREGDSCMWVGQTMTGKIMPPFGSGAVGGVDARHGGYLGMCAGAALAASRSATGWWADRGVQGHVQERLGREAFDLLWEASEREGSRGNAVGVARMAREGVRDSVPFAGLVLERVTSLDPGVVGRGLSLFGRDMSVRPEESWMDFASSGSSARKRVEQARRVLDMLPEAAMFADVSWSASRWPEAGAALRGVLDGAALRVSLAEAGMFKRPPSC